MQVKLLKQVCLVADGEDANQLECALCVSIAHLQTVNFNNMKNLKKREE